jgi:hypothetical protein
MLALATAAVMSSLVWAAPPPPSSALHCDACLLVAQSPPSPEVAARRAELTQQIADLTERTRSINVNWPGISVLLIYVGLGFAPNLILWAIFEYSGTVSPAVLNILGPTLLISGIVGAACLVGGVLLGVIWSAVARSHRETLVHEREALEAELKQLSRRDREEERVPAAWLAAWRF